MAKVIIIIIVLQMKYGEVKSFAQDQRVSKQHCQ